MTPTTTKEAAEQLRASCIGAAVNLTILALFVLFAWNVGVIGLIGAAGGYAAGISYWTALGSAVLLRLLAAAKA